jgi:hypothetical protein
MQKQIVRLGVLVLAVMASTACGADQPTSPQAGVRPNLEVVNPAARVTALRREQPLAQDVVVSATIGKRGGWFRIPEAGLIVVVPQGAVRNAAMTFTAVALKGSNVAYDFGPAGATFKVPLIVIQDLQGTQWRGIADLSNIRAAYFADNRQLDDLLGEAAVNEFLPTAVYASYGKVIFPVHHFSGYMVASGAARN